MHLNPREQEINHDFNLNVSLKKLSTAEHHSTPARKEMNNPLLPLPSISLHHFIFQTEASKTRHALS